MRVEPKPLPMREALEYWRLKVPMRADEFYRLYEGFRVNAFTVSGITKMDMLQSIRESLTKALSEGQSFETWKEAIAQEIDTLGWRGPGGESHLDNVFRTNIQTAYSVGRHKQMQRVKSLRPYWRYSAVNDSRTRPSHLAMHGLVYPADHPFWDSAYPPNGFRCRCTVVTLSRRQVESQGLKVEQENLVGQYRTPPRLPGEDAPKPAMVMPDAGFRTNPAREHYEPDLSKYPQAMREAFLERRPATQQGEIT